MARHLRTHEDTTLYELVDKGCVPIFGPPNDNEDRRLYTQCAIEMVAAWLLIPDIYMKFTDDQYRNGYASQKGLSVQDIDYGKFNVREFVHSTNLIPQPVDLDARALPEAPVSDGMDPIPVTKLNGQVLFEVEKFEPIWGDDISRHLDTVKSSTHTSIYLFNTPCILYTKAEHYGHKYGLESP